MSKPNENHVWHNYWSDTPDDPYLEAEAKVVAENLVDRFGLSDTDGVLDFGCGYGYVTEHLAPYVAHVWIWDKVEDAMAAGLRRIRHPNVSEIDPAHTNEKFDLIVVNSVIQYMSDDVLSDWLERWAGLLKSGGSIAISDVPTRAPSLVGEGLQWFRLALKHGVLIDAIRFAKANASRYRDARAKVGLATVSEPQLRRLADGAGLTVHREPRNLAYQSGRDSYVLTRATAP